MTQAAAFHADACVKRNGLELAKAEMSPAIEMILTGMPKHRQTPARRIITNIRRDVAAVRASRKANASRFPYGLTTGRRRIATLGEWDCAYR